MSAHQIESWLSWSGTGYPTTYFCAYCEDELTREQCDGECVGTHAGDYMPIARDGRS